MQQRDTDLSYVLITAARNEQAYIEMTIQSVIAQTVLPRKWVIVSDGSRDRTDAIVKRYEAKHDFIQFLRREADTGRNYGSKVYSIQAGIERLDGTEYDFIGNLDADVSFDANYYDKLLAQFRTNRRLGIAGGVLFERSGGKWIRQFSDPSWSVSGPIQLFRRSCYEDIGGYVPLPKGGVDAMAEVMARMHGWEVKSFPAIIAKHHRYTGTGKRHILLARFRQGIMEHSHGNDPLFEIAKCLLRIQEKPFVLGSLFRLSGFCWSVVRRNRREVPDNVVKFLRREQMQRLYRFPFEARKQLKGETVD